MHAIATSITHIRCVWTIATFGLAYAYARTEAEKSIRAIVSHCGCTSYSAAHHRGLGVQSPVGIVWVELRAMDDGDASEIVAVEVQVALQERVCDEHVQRRSSNKANPLVERRVAEQRGA